ncbi:MAG: amino acid permease, partial [Chloroflexota bacterium]|nr:amino acid permease [Chloroflexota bacterium]
SIIIAVVIYLLVAFVVLGALTPPAGLSIYQYLGQLGELGMAEAAGQFMPYGKVILLLAGIASTMSALNATIYSSSRVSFAMGRDGNLPRIFGQIHPIMRTPHWAVFISGALIILMAIALPIEDVAASADIMFLLLFMMVCYSLITLRERRPDLDRSFMVPFFPYTPWIGIILSILLSLTLFELSPVAWITTLLWIGAGFLLYFGYSEKQQEAMEAERRPILLEEVVAVKEFSVMVPVSDIGQAQSLGRLGALVASIHDGELFALHVVRVPQALSISEGRVFLRQGRGVLDAAVEVGKSIDVPVRTMLRLGRNIGKTIMATARQRGTNLILLGWPGYSHSQDVAFGTIIDLISQNPPSDVAVVRFRRAWQMPDRILLPARGAGPNVRLAFEMARDIVAFYRRPENGGHEVPIQALHVVTSQEAGSLARFRSQIQSIAENLNLSVDIEEVQAPGVVEGIVDASRHTDLIIMGASEEGVFEQRLFGNIPEQVMRQSPATIIMCKRYHGQVTNWVRRIFLAEAVDFTDPDIGGIRKLDTGAVEEVKRPTLDGKGRREELDVQVVDAPEERDEG